eukprot:1186821-Prorocentrum_minimum.AAC.2
MGGSGGGQEGVRKGSSWTPSRLQRGGREGQHSFSPVDIRGPVDACASQRERKREPSDPPSEQINRSGGAFSGGAFSEERSREERSQEERSQEEPSREEPSREKRSREELFFRLRR